MGSRIKNLLTNDWIVACNAGSDYNDFVLGLKTRQVGVLLKRVFLPPCLEQDFFKDT